MWGVVQKLCNLKPSQQIHRANLALPVYKALHFCSHRNNRGVTINYLQCKTPLICLFCAESQYIITVCTFYCFHHSDGFYQVFRVGRYLARQLVFLQWDDIVLYCCISTGLIAAVNSFRIVTSHLIIQ